MLVNLRFFYSWHLTSFQSQLILGNKTLNSDFELTPLFEPNKTASTELWHDFIGIYPSSLLSEVDGKASISIKNNQLYLTIYRADIPLYPISQNQFFTHDRFPLIEFEKNQNGEMVLKFTNKDGDIFSVLKNEFNQ